MAVISQGIETEMKTQTQRCYLLIMRHAVPSTQGRAGLEAVSRRLSETVSELARLPNHRIELRTVLHGDSDVATASAHFVRSQLCESAGFQGAICPHPLLNGVHASPYSGPFFESEKREALHVIGEHLDRAIEAGGNAILVVGHQPLMGIIARTGVGAHLRARWLRRSVPLAHAEVACLEGRRGREGFGSWRVLWTIAPSDENAIAQLREKIVAKMTVASIIGSVVAGALVLLLEGLFGSPPSFTATPVMVRYAAALSLFVATWLYLATVYYCDRLLMPPRFWGEPDRPPNRDRQPRWLVSRPPASASWILYQNMLYVWRWFFVPATSLSALGALLLGVALFQPPRMRDALVILFPFVAGVATLMGYCIWRRPLLGVED